MQFIARYVLTKFLAKRAYTKNMHLHGCQPIRKYPHTDPILGLDKLRKTKKAQAEGKSFKMASKEFATCGKTYQSHLMGMTTIHTMEWSNLHTVHTVEFEK